MRSEADILSVLFSWRCENCWRLSKPRCWECSLPILDKVSSLTVTRALQSLSSDAHGAGQVLPSRLLRLLPVRPRAGGRRVPRDGRPGQVHHLQRLLREVSRESQHWLRSELMNLLLQTQRVLVLQVPGAHRLHQGEEGDPRDVRGKEISLQLLHLPGETCRTDSVSLH